MIKTGPVGKLVEGHVLDVGKKSFERALKDYDHLLYVKWNPNKLRGWGCWEIRRRPAQKQVVDIIEWKGMSFLKLDYLETNMANHVLDAAFLNYDQLRKLKEMDTFNSTGFATFSEFLERKEADHVAKVKAKALESRKDAAKHHRSAIRDFRELVNSGFNPARIQEYWNQGAKK